MFGQSGLIAIGSWAFYEGVANVNKEMFIFTMEENMRGMLFQNNKMLISMSFSYCHIVSNMIILEQNICKNKDI